MCRLRRVRKTLRRICGSRIAISLALVCGLSLLAPRSLSQGTLDYWGARLSSRDIADFDADVRPCPTGVPNAWEFTVESLRSAETDRADQAVAIVVAPAVDDTVVLGDASRWAAPGADTAVVIFSGPVVPARREIKNAAGGAPDVSVFAARHMSDVPACVAQLGAFPSMDAALPGIAVALARGSTTIVVVSAASNATGLRAAGVFFPTDSPSLLPVASLFDVDSTNTTVGRAALPDIPCKTPAEADAWAHDARAPMGSRMGWQCGMPPREEEDVWEEPSPSLAHVWPRASGSGEAASVAGRHFMTAARLATPSTLTLCSVPVVAAVQYGLCQGLATNAVVNQAPWLSTPLDDQATPLVLPVGEPPPSLLAAPGGRSVPAEYGGMAVHASLAWALLPVVEPGLGHGVPALFHAVLALYGHAAVILPPGRLCGDAIGRVSAPASNAHLRNARDPVSLIQNLHASLSSRNTGSDSSWPLVDELLLAALKSEDVLTSLSLTGHDCRAIFRWLRSLRLAGFTFAAVPPSLAEFADSAAAFFTAQHAQPLGMSPAALRAIPRMSGSELMATVRASISDSARIVNEKWQTYFSTAEGGGPVRIRQESPSAAQGAARSCCGQHMPPLPALPGATPFLRHCVADGAHLRDIVLAVTFNNYGPFSPATTALLFSLYASAYPVMLSAGQATSTRSWNHVECHTAHSAGMDYDAFGAAHCPAVVLEAAPGHLGYLITNDDAIIQPWNLARDPPGRVWVFRRAAPATLQAPGAHFGCWSEDNRFGANKAAEAALGYRPRDIAMQTRSGGVPTGATCGLIDTVFVPGSLAADLARLLQLHVRTGTMVEIAIASSLAAVAPIADHHVLQSAYLWGNARPEPKVRWHTAWDAFHPIKLSQSRLQYWLWEEFKRAEAAGLLGRADVIPIGVDGVSRRPVEEPKRSVDFS